MAHLFVVAFYGELPTRQPVVVESGSILVGVHGAYVAGDGYPQVSRHREGSGREQMYVLCHVGIRGFGCQTVAQVVAQGEAGLCRQIALTLCVEEGQASSPVQAEPVGQFPVVFGIKGEFETPLCLIDAGSVGGVCRCGGSSVVPFVCGGDTGTEQMVDKFGAEPYAVACRGCIVEIHTSTPVAYARMEF